jgi:hypothetical protein
MSWFLATKVLLVWFACHPGPGIGTMTDSQLCKMNDAPVSSKSTGRQRGLWRDDRCCSYGIVGKYPVIPKVPSRQIEPAPKHYITTATGKRPRVEVGQLLAVDTPSETVNQPTAKPNGTPVHSHGQNY